MLTYINGNILDIREGIICQQVNCLGVVKNGLMKQIYEKYPWAEKCYKTQVKSKEDKTESLGTYQMWLVQTEPKLWICDLFGQYGYGACENQTDYYYLFKALEGMIKEAKSKHLNVYIPYELGCGLAGGWWPAIEKYLYDLSNAYNKNINIVKLDK